jgi:hypothetical protein
MPVRGFAAWSRETRLLWLTIAVSLGVLYVLERRDHQDRLLVQALPKGAQDLSRLGGVGRAGDQLQRHRQYE